MEKEIQSTDFKTATTKNTTPSETPPLSKILEISRNTFAEFLYNLFNECLITGNVYDNLKLADITPIFMKKDPLNKEN